jgi:beta-aspartyl-peptidase (threonine type)
MKFISVIAALIMTAAIPVQAASTWAIVVHGGAGVIEREDLSPEQETAYRAAMNRAIQAGAAVLTKGGSALDAVETTIELM